MDGDRNLKRSKADAAFFGEVYRAHARPVLLYLTKRTYDRELALDLVAETFAQALASRRRLRGHTLDDEAAWLFGIARNVLSRYVRRGQAEQRAVCRLGVEVPDMEPAEVTRIIELAGLSELRGAVARELHALDADQSEAVRYRIVDELPYADVADRLQVSEPTARARVSRGLRALAVALEQRANRGENLA